LHFHLSIARHAGRALARISAHPAPRARALAILAVTSLALTGPARAYEQSEAVRKHYPDPPQTFSTPAFVHNRAGFTTQEEMMAYVGALARRYANVQLRIIGRSQEGRAIPLLILSSARPATPADVIRLGRPIVWLQGLQHGDEPAGGEAMLALAQSLAGGELRDLLDRITVIIVPRANPDGAARSVRRTARGVDVNSDHVKFDLPETIALHRASNEYQPQVFVDAHEFRVARPWLEKFGGLAAADLMLLYATNLNIPPPLTRLSDELFRPAIARALEHDGLRTDWYFMTSDDPADMSVSMGNTAPDIARNAYGLANTVSFLLESRGAGIGREGYARRVASHYVAAGAILRTAASNAERLQRTVAEARAASARERDDIVVVARGRQDTVRLRLADPVTGEDRFVDVGYENPLYLSPVLVRTRPHAYLLLPAYGELARKLMLNGAQVRQLLEPATLEVENFEVLEKSVSSEVYEGHNRTHVRTELSRRLQNFPAGSYYIPMNQPNGDLVALALEPESPSSFVSFGLLPVEKKGGPSDATGEIPVFRLLAPAPITAVIVEAAPQ
jgi:hypothetical protein